MSEHELFMRAAIQLAEEGLKAGAGGPFGAVVVKNGIIVGRGWNQVTSMNDPTAHAEVMAIRDACSKLGSFQLDDCEIYTSCEPCPMCLGAIYWARPNKVYYACTHNDAAKAGFDDSFIYKQMALHPGQRRIPATELLRTESLLIFKKWAEKSDKVKY